MASENYREAALAAVERMERSLARADAEDQWGKLAATVSGGLLQYAEMVLQQHGLEPAERTALLRWLQLRYLEQVAALDPSLQKALGEFLSLGRRTMDEMMAAACALQYKLHLRSWCEQVVHDPALAEAGEPLDPGQVNRLLVRVAARCTERLPQWSRDGLTPRTLDSQQYQLLGVDFTPTES